MKLLLCALLFLMLGCSYVPPNYSAMLISSDKPTNTAQVNLGVSGTNLGINVRKPDQSDSVSISRYPLKTFTQSIFSFDYFINTKHFHFAPNYSSTNTSLGMGFDYKNRFLFMITPGFHFIDENIPSTLNFLDNRFINYHTSVNISSSKNTILLISNDIFKSQFLITERNHDFSHSVTPYMNKLAFSLFFYDTFVVGGLEVSFLNSYDFKYYGAGVMFTFGLK